MTPTTGFDLPKAKAGFAELMAAARELTSDQSDKVALRFALAMICAENIGQYASAAVHLTITLGGAGAHAVVVSVVNEALQILESDHADATGLLRYMAAFSHAALGEFKESLEMAIAAVPEITREQRSDLEQLLPELSARLTEEENRHRASSN